jgi:hypothetical protein
MQYAGADPGFQVRGGALNKIAPSGGRRQKFGGISCEESRFYAKKNHIFSNFRGSRAESPPPGSAPNMDYTPLLSAFKMKTKNIRIASIQIYEI